MATSQPPVPIASTPAAGQLVEHDGQLFQTVREGSAFILIPPNTRTSVDPQAKAKAGESELFSSSLPFSAPFARCFCAVAWYLSCQ